MVARVLRLLATHRALLETRVALDPMTELVHRLSNPGTVSASLSFTTLSSRDIFKMHFI